MAQAKIARKDCTSRAPTTPLRAFLLALAVVCCSCNSSDTSPQDSARPRLPVGTVRSASTVADDYRSLIMSHGPAGYWRLGEATGNVARDEATPGHPGTYVGTYPPDGPLPILGQPGAVAGDTAAQFFLSNSTTHSPPLQSTWVEIPDAPNQQPSDNKITLECWFNITPGPSNPQNMSALISKTTLNYTDGYGFYVYLGQVYFYVTGYNNRIGVPVGYSSTLHHIVGTFDGAQMQLYYDGQLVGTRPWAAYGIAAGTAPLRIGKSLPYAGWPGLIDEVAIYDRVLSDSEIQSHYQLAHAAATGPNNSIESFALYADKSITLGMYVVTAGGATGVASPAPSSFGPQLVVGPSNQIDPVRDVFAPSVSLASKASVGGVVTNSLTNNGARLAEQFPYPATMPRVPLALPATPGTTNVTVATGQTQTLNPGNFGVLTANGTVNLNPGTYSFASVTVGNSAKLVALPGGSVDLRIARTLSTGVAAQISTSGQPANALTISVSGSDGASGAPPAVSLGANTTLVGIIIAPRGTLSFGTRVNATGAYAAFSIVAANNVAVTFQSGLPSQAQQPAGMQQLSGYRTPDIENAPLVGPVPANTPVWLGITLPVQAPTDFPALADFAKQVSDPTHPRYRQFLSPSDYESKYAPSQDSYDKLTAFVTGNGLSILHSYDDHELMEVGGTAAQVNQALFANLNSYLRPDGTLFYALDREPSVNTPLGLLHIAGTSNFVLPTAAGTSGSGPNGSLRGNDLKNAYIQGCSDRLDGSMQSILLLEIEGFNQPDVDRYTQNAGIPGVSPMVRDFTANILGFSTPPIVATDKESALDIEVAHAMAPGANIVVYEASVAEWDGVVISFDLTTDMMHAAVHPPAGYPLAKQVSSSWFFYAEPEVNQDLQALAAQGQSFFQSSGDGGAYTRAPSDIRSHDYVTLVGGTKLLTFGDGQRPTESTYSGSGGGILGGFTAAARGAHLHIPCVAMPTYQAGFANPSNEGSSTCRNVPDVAMLGVNADAVGPMNGAQNDAGTNGTSISAPMFAAFMALANEQSELNHVPPVGFANPALYAIGDPHGSLASTCFNDIKDLSVNLTDDTGPGFVDSSTADIQVGSGFQAVQGYDLATGLGSPTCALIDQLASLTPTVPAQPPPPRNHLTPLAAIGPGDTCLNDQGVVECWGLDQTGQDGAGRNAIDTSQHLNPVCTAKALDGVQALSIAMGSGHACELSYPDGTVWCWGDNTHGQLGVADAAPNALTEGAAVVIERLPLTSVQLAAGGGTTCALLLDGTVQCWGQNDQGQLGIGADSLAHPAPMQVQGLPASQQIVISPHGDTVCALTRGGAVYCWGDNSKGQLGNGSTTPSPTPVPAELALVGGGVRDATYVSLSDTHACAIIAQSGAEQIDGLWCWGGNSSAELGQGTNSAPVLRGMPMSNGVPSDITAVACGDAFTCVLEKDASVQCWGDNSYGQVGNGASDPPATFYPNPSIAGPLIATTTTAIAAGPNRACAALATGDFACWGDGPIGDGTTGHATTPTLAGLHRCVP